MSFRLLMIMWLASVAVTVCSASADEAVNLQTLLNEMADREALARWPQPVYQQRQASSYNGA